MLTGEPVRTPQRLLGGVRVPGADSGGGFRAMTKATEAQRRAEQECLAGEYQQSVLRVRQVRAISALVREEARQVIAEAKARRSNAERRSLVACRPPASA